LIPVAAEVWDRILHSNAIGDRFGALFREPSLKLLPSFGGGGGNNMPLISKYALELILYLIDYLKKNPRKAALLLSRLDMFDNGVSFVSSTLRQIVFWKKDLSDRSDTKIVEVLRLCKQIQEIIRTISGGMIVVHLCVNKLLTLWVNANKRFYVKDSAIFEQDEEYWEKALHVSVRHDCKIRLTRLKKYNDIKPMIDWIKFYDPIKSQTIITTPVPTPTPTPKVCENDGVCWRQNPDHWKNIVHLNQSYPVKKPRTGGSTRQSKMDTHRRQRRSFSTRTARTHPHPSTKRRRRTHTRRHRH
jgi:hypothetical protein